MKDDSATAKLLHRAIIQFGRHYPTVREQYEMAAITGLISADPTITGQQLRTKARAIADLMIDGRQRGDAD